jgi:hypothetical protein
LVLLQAGCELQDDDVDDERGQPAGEHEECRARAQSWYDSPHDAWPDGPGGRHARSARLGVGTESWLRGRILARARQLMFRMQLRTDAVVVARGFHPTISPVPAIEKPVSKPARTIWVVEITVGRSPS